MAPAGSPTRKATWGGQGGYNQNQKKRGDGDISYSTIDAEGHPEKLPRPLAGIDAEAVYGSIEEESPCAIAGPGKSSPGSDRGNVAREKNAARQFLWLSMEGVLLRPPELAASLPLPLAAVLTPFADSADCTSLPISDTKGEEPLRCTRCRCYVNAHFKWSLKDSSKFQCNMCNHTVEVPENIREDLTNNGQVADESVHPELVYGSVDFTASCLEEDTVPSVPSVCYAIETSCAAVSSGFTASVLEALEHVFEDEQLSLERSVSVVTYDDVVTFYEPTRSGRWRTVLMTDVHEPFLPVAAQCMAVNVVSEEGRAMLLELLASLRQEFSGANMQSPPTSLSPGSDPFHLDSEGEKGVATGAVIKTAVEALSVSGGDVVLFQASAPSLGIGSDFEEEMEGASPTSVRHAASLSSPMSAKSSSLASPASPTKTPKAKKSSFPEEMHRRCCRTGVAVSCVTAPAAGTVLDLQQLQWLPWRTGGDVLHLPSFTPANLPFLSSNLSHWAKKMQASAYNCVVRLRCSKGLECKNLIANWPAAASSEDQSAFEVPRLSPDTSVTFVLRPDLNTGDDEDWPRYRDRQPLCVQAAVLYSNSKGERLLRTHTAHIPVVNSVRQVYHNLNIQPLMAVLIKQAVIAALAPEPNAKTLPRDMLLEICLQVLSVYRKKCLDYHNIKKCLVTSKRLNLMPLYVLTARKLLYTMAGSEDKASSHENLQRLLRMPIHSLMLALYPRVYPLPAPDHEGADLPRSTPAMEEHVAKGSSPAYLITNGLGMWYHQLESGADQSSELRENAVKLAERIRAELQPSQAWIPLTELTRLPTGLAQEEAIAAKTADLTPSGRPRFGSRTGAQNSGARTPASPQVSWQEKVLLSSLFVEDDGVTEMGYSEWVKFIQEQVGFMM